MSPNEGVKNVNKLKIIELFKSRAARTQPLNNGTSLRVGEKVRKRIYKGKLDKASKPNFSKKIYTCLVKVINSRTSHLPTKYLAMSQRHHILAMICCIFLKL